MVAAIISYGLTLVRTVSVISFAEIPHPDLDALRSCTASFQVDEGQFYAAPTQDSRMIDRTSTRAKNLLHFDTRDNVKARASPR